MDPWALEEGFAAQLQALAPKDPLVLAVSGEGGFRGPPLPRPPDGAARGGDPDGPLKTCTSRIPCINLHLPPFPLAAPNPGHGAPGSTPGPPDRAKEPSPPAPSPPTTSPPHLPPPSGPTGRPKGKAPRSGAPPKDSAAQTDPGKTRSSSQSLGQPWKGYLEVGAWQEGQDAGE